MTDKEKLERKNKKITLIMRIVSLLVIVGVGYAFFSASVSNTNNEKFSTQTATIALEFDDNDNGVSGTLNLGESITKKFTLENTGTKDAYAKINWVNLVNTYLSGNLSYTLEQSTSENGTYTSIGSGNVPTSNASTTTVLKNGILVPVNTMYYYKLTITLNNLDVEQNADINGTFYSYFNLEEGILSGADKLLQMVADSDSTSTDVITKTAPSGATCTNTLAYDGTIDNNLRYVGANPCNYVTFNEENAGWRIVGIMNNIDDGTGKKETRIKLVRKDSLGSYSWDSSASNINFGDGVNDWTQADLKNELNGNYLDTTLNTNPNWYNGSNNTQTAEYDYTKGLSQAAQSQIRNAKWYLGGNSTHAATTSQFYEYERGTTVWGSTNGQTCNDGYCPRALDWTGKVALMYPSDYGFAVGGSMRSTCLGKNLNLYRYSSESCYTNDWIKSTSSFQWLLSPLSSGAYSAFGINYESNLGRFNNYSPGIVRPAVYLSSDVSISGGNGSESDPYVID